MSNTGWTPAAPGHTNDVSRPGNLAENRYAAVSPTNDAIAEQVVDLDVERTEDVVIVRIGGEVDMLTTPMLSSLINKQFESELSTLVLDMRRVGFLGSSGLAALVTARDEAANHGVSLRLVTAERAVLRPLTATGLADLFDVYPDLETALGA